MSLHLAHLATNSTTGGQNISPPFLVDPQRHLSTPAPMPLVLPAQQYHNPPHLPTPASYNFQAGGLGWRNRSSEVTPSRKTGGWTVSLRDGLPTPPSDMTGVSFNTSVASNYAMKKPHNNVYNHTTYPSISTLFHTGKTNSLAQAAKSNPLFSAPESTRSREMEDQKQKTNSSIATYLQIPSSINNSKGSLAEFAAQVRPHLPIFSL